MGDDVRVKRLAVVIVAGFALLASLSAAPAAQPQAAGVQHLQFRFGPVHIRPGQNTIEFAINNNRPQVNGWIVGFRPDLKYARGGGTPRVDVIHLHHGVWLVNGAPTFAAGEEKTIVNVPRGFGFVADEETGLTTFFHMSGCLTPFNDLRVGDRVMYEIVSSPRDHRKPQARDVQLVRS